MLCELGNGNGADTIDDDIILHRSQESVGLALEELDSAMHRVRISRSFYACIRLFL